MNMSCMELYWKSSDRVDTFVEQVPHCKVNWLVYISTYTYILFYISIYTYILVCISTYILVYIFTYTLILKFYINYKEYQIELQKHKIQTMKIYFFIIYFGIFERYLDIFFKGGLNKKPKSLKLPQTPYCHWLA